MWSLRLPATVRIDRNTLPAAPLDDLSSTIRAVGQSRRPVETACYLLLAAIAFCLAASNSSPGVHAGI